MTDFIDIENDIISQLKEDILYLETVSTIESDIVAKISKLNLKYPAALVMYTGSKFQLVDRTIWEEKPTFTIFTVARTLRSRDKARKGDDATTTKGAYDIVKDVLLSLTNQNFGRGEIFRMSPVGVTSVLFTDRMVVYAIEMFNSFDTDYGNV